MNVIHLVAQEVASRFHKQVLDCPTGSAITTDLAALLTRLWLLKDRSLWDDSGNVAASVPYIERITDEMVDYLMHGCSLPSLATLSLQVRWESLRSSREEQLRKVEVKREAIRVQLEGALMSIEPGLATPEQVWGSLAVCFLHHYSNLGPLPVAGAKVGNGSGPAHAETASAVSAALPRTQVTAFLRQDRLEQTSQLRQLRRITWGLRLYQKEMGRSMGADLWSLSSTADEPLAELEEKCEEAVTELEPRVRLTRALLASPSCSLSAAAVQLLKEEYHHLLLVQHFQRCVRCRLQQLRDIMNTRVMQTFTNLIAELRQLLSPSGRSIATAASTMASMTASSGTTADPTASLPAAPPTTSNEPAPKKVVFAKFMELADAYEVGMQCSGELSHWAALLRVATDSAAAYTSTLPTTVAENALARQDAVPLQPPATSTRAMEAEIGALLESDTTQQRLPAGVHVRYRADLPLHTVDPITAQVYAESVCAMRGYCPVQFISGRPLAELLLPGLVPRSSPVPPSPSAVSLGCIEVSGSTQHASMCRPLYFLFADAASMRAFAADPWKYVDGCLHVFHDSDPSVTLVMGGADELPRELYLEGARALEKMNGVSAAATLPGEARQDCGTQTGQIDPYMDYHYFWNEWDLRRHALKLANLMNMRTHSSQTVDSHLRREAGSQADPLREAQTQTRQDAATQPPHTVQYLKGLRGTETSAVEQVRREVHY